MSIDKIDRCAIADIIYMRDALLVFESVFKEKTEEEKRKHEELTAQINKTLVVLDKVLSKIGYIETRRVYSLCH